MTDICYDQEVAESVSRDTYAPADDDSISPPRLFFSLRSTTVFVASPPGALVTCTLTGDRESRVRVLSTQAVHVADVTVHVPDCEDTTTETIAIASALYWSWWRAERMHGRTHGELTPICAALGIEVTGG